MKFLIINGPNLNLMHFTEPGVAGQIDYNALLDYLEVCCQQMDIQVEFFQSNHEGDLIDEIQSAAGRVDGMAHLYRKVHRVIRHPVRFMRCYDNGGLQCVLPALHTFLYSFSW